MFYFMYLKIVLKIATDIFFSLSQTAKGIQSWYEVAKDIYCQCQNFYQENHQILEGGCLCRN